MRRGTERSRDGTKILVVGLKGPKWYGVWVLQRVNGPVVGLTGPATVLYDNPRRGTERSRDGTKILVGGLNGPATVQKSSSGD